MDDQQNDDFFFLEKNMSSSNNENIFETLSSIDNTGNIVTVENHTGGLEDFREGALLIGLLVFIWIFISAYVFYYIFTERKKIRQTISNKQREVSK